MKSYYSSTTQDVIGNEPVLDQFDVSYPASFYGSAQDDYITGTLLTVNQIETVRLGRRVYAIGERGRLFSKAYASSQPALDSTFGSAEVSKNPSYAERLVPWKEKVSHSHRIVQCIDERERFYDSCLPSIKNCLSGDESNVWFTYDNPEYWLSPYGNIKSSEDTAYILFNAKPIASHPLSNNTWTWSFPYEDKYKPNDRLINTEKIFLDLTSDVATNWYPISFNKLKRNRTTRQANFIFPLLPGKKQIQVNDISFKVDPSLPDSSNGSYRILIPSDINLATKAQSTEYLTQSMSRDDMIKFLFGFGDLNNIAYTSYTLNEDEDDEEQIISSSYFTGFELQNWTAVNPAGAPFSFNSSSYNGHPILLSGSAVTYFNAQFDQPSGSVIVRWVAPSGSIGQSDGLDVDVTVFNATLGTFIETTSKKLGSPASSYFAQSIGYQEYPWVLVTRENFTTASFGESDQTQVYNYISQSSYYSYAAGNTPYVRGQVLTGSSGVYWQSSSSPSRHWVLGSFLSSSFRSTTSTYLNIFRMPDPKFRGGKTVSTQRMDITASYPWKIAYQRAVSAHVSDYFRTSFSGMPGFPSSLGNVDLEIERLYGTDVPFQGTQQIETTPQVMSDFTSSLYPPGEYQIKFSYVKTGESGSTNRIDRAFIDNVSILTFSDNQLTSTFDPNYRIGYSHYPEFRQIIRDTRTSPYFPGVGLKGLTSIYKDASNALSALDFFNTSPQAQRNITVSPTLASSLTTTALPSTVSTQTTKNNKYNQVSINYSSDPTNISNVLNPYSTAKTTTAVFNINPARLTTINRVSKAVDASTLARLSILDEAARYLKNNSYGGYEIAISPVIRGWKYGIYNGFPAHSRAVFRRNRYGQFRDMLEQRLFTKFFNTDKTSIKNVTRGNDNTKPIDALKNLSVQEGPVTVKFVRQTLDVDENNLGKVITIEIDPVQTTSQNLTRDASSSVPYFDGESKSRFEETSGGSRFVLTTSTSPAVASLQTQNMTITSMMTSNATQRTTRS